MSSCRGFPAHQPFFRSFPVALLVHTRARLCRPFPQEREQSVHDDQRLHLPSKKKRQLLVSQTTCLKVLDLCCIGRGKMSDIQLNIYRNKLKSMKISSKPFVVLLVIMIIVSHSHSSFSWQQIVLECQ